jgi:hypothetical protein
MRRRRIAALICLCAISAIALAGKQGQRTGKTSSKFVSSGAKVTVKKVVQVLTGKETRAYSVVYEYEFPGRSSVFIDHLGTVPGKGSFGYISTDNRLEFRDRPRGDLLASVPLEETVVVAAKPPLMQVPDESQFQGGVWEPTWDSPDSLHERANAVLGKYFRYEPRSDKGVVYLRTTFTPLPLTGVREGVIAKLAILLVFADRPESDKYPFSIKSLVKEGRSHSDEYRDTSNPAVAEAAKLFVTNLVAEMKAAKP